MLARQSQEACVPTSILPLQCRGSVFAYREAEAVVYDGTLEHITIEQNVTAPPSPLSLL